jgi:hypothetical protein
LVAVLFWYVTPLFHRVGRVLSLFSSRRKWDYPNLSPAGEWAHFFGSGWRGTLAGERGDGRGPIPTRGHCGTVLYVLCALVRQPERSIFA